MRWRRALIRSTVVGRAVAGAIVRRTKQRARACRRKRRRCRRLCEYILCVIDKHSASARAHVSLSIVVHVPDE